MNTAFYYYHIDGIILRSNLPLPQLIPVNHATQSYDYDFYADEPIYQPQYAVDYQLKIGDGISLLRLDRQSTNFILRFNGIADFTISADNNRIHCHPCHGVPMNSIHHLLLDNVLPHVLNLHGKIVLHASAVATEKGAIAFLAPSGTGKSSLAVAFFQYGIPLLADDSVVVAKTMNGFALIPSYPGVRLWSSMVNALWQQSGRTEAVNHYSSKQRIMLRAAGFPFWDSPAPLKKIYVLSPTASQFAIADITPRDAHIELVKHAFRLDMINKKNMVTSFTFYNELIKEIPFVYVLYPHKVELLTEIVDTLLKDADL